MEEIVVKEILKSCNWYEKIIINEEKYQTYKQRNRKQSNYFNLVELEELYKMPGEI